MGVEEVSALRITCDNPDCPGTDLDPSDRTGWIFVSSEIYGKPTTQNVFCSSFCVGAHADAAVDDPDNVFPPTEEEETPGA